MKRSLVTVLSASMLALLASAPVIAAHEGTREAQDPVYVDSAVVQAAADDPSRWELVVTGMLPTPCHQPAWAVTSSVDAIEVALWSAQEGGGLCAAVLEPVELAVPLGELDPGATPVLLDGHPVEVAAPDAVAVLSAAGWSFGMCQGYCAADLQLEGQVVVLTGRDRDRAEPVFVNAGQLTTEGASRLAQVSASIGDSALEPVYGCPDCADGGAAYLTLLRAEGESRHEMEFGAPPEPLAPLYELAMSIASTLEACAASDLVTVDEGCVDSTRPPGSLVDEGPPDGVTPAGESGDTVVTMDGSQYHPNPLEVSAGTTVIWMNDDLAPHTVTAAEGGFDSGLMPQGATFSLTFETAGTYPIFCVYHPRMRATVIVH